MNFNHSLLGAQDSDNANPFWCTIVGFANRAISRLSNQRGEFDVSDEDDDEPKFDDDGNPIQKAAGSTEEELDDARALAYLERKGLKYDSFEQIANQRNSVSGLTKKAEEASRLKDQLDAIQRATSGQGRNNDNEIPEELKGMKPETLKALEVAIKHMSKSELETLKSELRSEFRAELFGSKHDDFKDNEKEFVKFLDARGIIDNGQNLDWAYKQFLAEKETGDGGDPALISGKQPPKPGNVKITRVGVSPKPGDRSGGGKAATLDEASDRVANAQNKEELAAALEEFNELQDGG